MIPLWLTSLFGNIWFRRACVVALCLAALWFYGERERAKGRKEGVKQATDEISQANEKRFEQMRAEFMAKDAERQAQIDALNVQLKAYQETAKLLSAQRQQAAVTVAGMNESQVDAKIQAEFGKRLEQFTLEDKKKVAQCSEQLGFCDQQRLNLEQQNQTLTDKADKVEQRYDLLGAYTSNVEQAYISEYNANKHKKRAWKCLKLWRCGVDEIKPQNLPPLLKERPVKP